MLPLYLSPTLSLGPEPKLWVVLLLSLLLEASRNLVSEGWEPMLRWQPGLGTGRGWVAALMGGSGQGSGGGQHGMEHRDWARDQARDWVVVYRRWGSSILGHGAAAQVKGWGSRALLSIPPLPLLLCPPECCCAIL